MYPLLSIETYRAMDKFVGSILALSNVHALSCTQSEIVINLIENFSLWIKIPGCNVKLVLDNLVINTHTHGINLQKDIKYHKTFKHFGKYH